MLTSVGVPVESEAEPSAPDPARSTLICFSHLRWDFVFQRPQHLMSRFAREMTVVLSKSTREVASLLKFLPEPPAGSAYRHYVVRAHELEQEGDALWTRGYSGLFRGDVLRGRLRVLEHPRGLHVVEQRAQRVRRLVPFDGSRREPGAGRRRGRRAAAASRGEGEHGERHRETIPSYVTNHRRHDPSGPTGRRAPRCRAPPGFRLSL